MAEQPVFNDIIPRTRAQRVSYLTQTFFRKTWLLVLFLTFSSLNYWLIGIFRLPWKIKSWLRILVWGSEQAVIINMLTQLRCTTPILPQVTSFQSRNALIKTLQLQIRKLDNSNSSTCKIDGRISERNDSTEKSADLKTWSKVKSNKRKFST